MKIAVLISAARAFPAGQIIQAINLAKEIDTSITGIITSEQGLDYYPMGEGGMIDVVQERIETAENQIRECEEEFRSLCEAHGIAQEWYGKHGFIRHEWPALSPYFDLVVATPPFSAPNWQTRVFRPPSRLPVQRRSADFTGAA